MIAAVLSGFIVALALAFGGGLMKGRASVLIGLLPTALFIYFLSLWPQISGDGLFYNYHWVPSIGVNLSFRLDGLSLLFALMITGVGALVFFYTSAYLKNHPHLDRF